MSQVTPRMGDEPTVDKVCEICPDKPTFACGLDYDTHMLFQHGTLTSSPRGISDEIKNKLQKKYDREMKKLSILSNDSNEKGVLYHNYFKGKTGIKIGSNYSKESKKLWDSYMDASAKWQKQCYRINSIVYDMESYGLSESDFQ